MIDVAWAAIAITLGGGITGALLRTSSALARLDERVGHLGSTIDKLLTHAIPVIAQRAAETDERLADVAMTVRELEIAVSDTGARAARWGRRQ